MHGNGLMTDCSLQQLNNGKWWCPDCDPKRKRLLPINAHRNCPKALPRMIAQFDALMDSGDDEAADELAKRIMCYELRRLNGKPCKKVT